MRSERQRGLKGGGRLKETELVGRGPLVGKSGVWCSEVTGQEILRAPNERVPVEIKT